MVHIPSKFEWVENWRYTKLGTYSEEAAQMGINMKFTLFGPIAEAAKNPLVEELETGREDFVLTGDQIAELSSMAAREALRSENRKAQL